MLTDFIRKIETNLLRKRERISIANKKHSKFFIENITIFKRRGMFSQADADCFMKFNKAVDNLLLESERSIRVIRKKRLNSLF